MLTALIRGRVHSILIRGEKIERKYNVIGIIDYKAGNLTSVKRALDYLAIPNLISADPGKILACDRIIFPGVGHAATAMKVLKERGFDVALTEAFKKGIPIMGICLGTQIILEHSEEGDTDCVGLIPGTCVKFNLADKSLKIPHMGWNEPVITQQHYIFKDVPAHSQFYFVHSYYPQPANSSMVLATCEYGQVFPCAIGRDNLIATQFHPEKSGAVGLGLLKRFSTWEGSVC
jgi:glutamine amidotransferase